MGRKAKVQKIFLKKLYGEEIRIGVMGWWDNLSSSSRAQLRRCATPSEVALHREMYMMRTLVPAWISVEAVATITGVLAHIREGREDMTPFIQKLAIPKERTGRAPFSENRFQQLMKCSTWDDFYTLMRRSIALLDRSVNPLAVADFIVLWGEHEKDFRFNVADEYYTEAMKHDD